MLDFVGFLGGFFLIFFFCPKACDVVLVMSVKVSPAGTNDYFSGDLLAGRVGQGFVVVAGGDGCSANTSPSGQA